MKFLAPEVVFVAVVSLAAGVYVEQRYGPDCRHAPTSSATNGALNSGIVNVTNYSSAKRQFVVTHHMLKEPLRVVGTDQIDALSRAGFTVWTQREWDNRPKRPSLK